MNIEEIGEEITRVFGDEGLSRHDDLIINSSTRIVSIHCKYPEGKLTEDELKEIRGWGFEICEVPSNCKCPAREYRVHKCL